MKNFIISWKLLTGGGLKDTVSPKHLKKKKAPKEVTTKLFKVIEGKVHKSSQKKTYMLCSEQLT